MRIKPLIVVAVMLSWSAPGSSSEARLASRPPDAQAPAARAEAIVDTGEFMDLFMDAVYGDLKKAVTRPSPSRKEIAAVYAASIRLAEISNLLFARDPDRYTKEPEWPRFSAEMRETAASVADAALVALQKGRPKDFEPVRERFRGVAEACNACHRGLKTDAKTIKP